MYFVLRHPNLSHVVRFSCNETMLQFRFVRAAGAINRWQNIVEMLQDPRVVQEFIKGIDEAYETRRAEYAHMSGRKIFENRFSIEYPGSVGFSLGQGEETDLLTVRIKIRFANTRCNIDVVDVYADEDAPWDELDADPALWAHVPASANSPEHPDMM